MHGVEAVRIAEEIVRRLRGATDAGDLCHPVRLDRQFVAGLDDRGGDRIVAAARAQRRDLALVVAMRVAELVLLEARMMEFRFCDVGHDTALRSGVTLR